MLHPFHSAYRCNFGLRHLYESHFQIMDGCESVLKRSTDDFARYVVFSLAASQHAVKAFESFVENRDIVEEFIKFLIGVFEGYNQFQ